MGTRNLTLVTFKKETRVAQYGQWDGYPAGQGATVVDFIKKYPVTKMVKMLERVKFIDNKKQKELDKFFKSIGVTDGWMDMEQAAKYQEKYPLLTRDNGADVLNLLMESKEEVLWLTDSRDFLKDGLFCEWAYELDLDKRILKVYNGGTKPIATYTFKELKGMTTDEWSTKVEKVAYEDAE